jgi:hypothetical protein
MSRTLVSKYKKHKDDPEYRSYMMKKNPDQYRKLLDKDQKKEEERQSALPRKRTVRITESELKKIIAGSVTRILKEAYDDNYPPGFNGHFPGEDDDIDAIDFGGDVYNETLQWLQRNPDEFTTDAKQLFRAMGGNERTFLKDGEDGLFELQYIFGKIRQAIKDFDQQ